MRFLLASSLAGLLLAGLFVSAATTLGEEPKVAKEGEKAPDFKLKGSDGKEYSLKQFAGTQAVVIAWFPKAFTGGCTKECTSMRENGEEIRKYEVAYFTASCDTPEKNTDFAKSLLLDYPILSDPDRKVAKAYGLVEKDTDNPKRWTFYIDKDGVIRHIDKMVNTAAHGKDIAKKLDELGIAKKK
jgi:thioredoxin-dependent peroxiredoxin